MSTPAISVLVPVWNAEGFVADTLDGISRQSFDDIEVLVSVDRSEDRSAQICRGFEDDSRFTVCEQDEPLGWAGNINSLTSRMRGSRMRPACVKSGN